LEVEARTGDLRVGTITSQFLGECIRGLAWGKLIVHAGRSEGKKVVISREDSGPRPINTSLMERGEGEPLDLGPERMKKGEFQEKGL